MKHPFRLALAATTVVALAACSTSGPSADSDGSGVKTGSGVTADTITVGMLTDLSGPFAAGATVQVAQTKAYWKQVSDDGGICGRKVEVDVQDHGYDPQKAVALYRSMSSDVVALQQVLGSPVVSAVLPLAEEDDLYVGGQGWASVSLDYKVSQLPGSTYSIEGANAIDYLVDSLGISKGDKVGHVYFAGDYGNDSLAGATYAAKERGVEIVPQEITPAVSDLQSQASALKKAGVKAVILSAAPTQLASLAGSLAALGVNVPIMGDTPTFNPALLDTPAKQALLDNVYSVMSIAPYDADEPGVKAAAELYKTAAPDGAIGWEVPLAYAQAELLKAALTTACDNEDLTSKGVVDAIAQTTDLDTKGLFAAPLDYSTPGEPPTRKVYIAKVDAGASAGLKVVDAVEGPSAKSYSFK